MPEGHTIHRLARDLNLTMGQGAVIAGSPQGRFAAGAALINGSRLLAADAWGKYLACAFDDGHVLHVHLGLIGKLRPADVASSPGPTIRLRLENDRHAWHLTGPTRCELVTPEQWRAITSRLGADPLRPRPDVGTARARLAATRKPIGAVLLDQSVIAGVGNVYRAELLFVCGLHPETPAADLDDATFAELWDRLVRLMRIGVRLNRIVTTTPELIGRSRPRMEPDDRLYVYHRDHCRLCSTELRTIELAGRPMQYCPVCQARGGARGRAQSDRNSAAAASGMTGFENVPEPTSPAAR